MTTERKEGPWSLTREREQAKAKMGDAWTSIAVKYDLGKNVKQIPVLRTHRVRYALVVAWPHCGYYELCLNDGGLYDQQTVRGKRNVRTNWTVVNLAAARAVYQSMRKAGK